MAGQVPAGTYVRASSVHDSLFRAITLHGTQGVLLEGNSAFDIAGHAYFLEDGAEWGNTLRGNLGMLGEAQGGVEGASWII
jgi:cell migration-inducing and hyaluronan-binding protein